MAVKRVKYRKNRAGTRFDEKQNCYIGYRIDVRLNGQRFRNKIFPTKSEAERYVQKLKLEESYIKRGLSEDELVDLFVGVREKTIDFKEFKRCISAYQKER